MCRAWRVPAAYAGSFYAPAWLRVHSPGRVSLRAIEMRRVYGFSRGAARTHLLTESLLEDERLGLPVVTYLHKSLICLLPALLLIPKMPLV